MHKLFCEGNSHSILEKRQLNYCNQCNITLPFRYTDTCPYSIRSFELIQFYLKRVYHMTNKNVSNLFNENLKNFI